MRFIRIPPLQRSFGLSESRFTSAPELYKAHMKSWHSRVSQLTNK